MVRCLQEQCLHEQCLQEAAAMPLAECQVVPGVCLCLTAGFAAEQRAWCAAVLAGSSSVKLPVSSCANMPSCSCQERQ